MSEISIRIVGVAGRITLNRPKALNAITYDMVRAIDDALDAWRGDDRVQLIVMDAEGDKAFSAGGDIADLYATGMTGDFAFGRDFWRDEYRMNAKIAEYSKPIVSFLHGFTMGGGMGVGCHGSHRIVGESSQIAMPECGVGLVPDVGGSMILANAPGHLGVYCATTGARMGPADAIRVGFADMFIPQEDWPELITALENKGDLSALSKASQPAPTGHLGEQQPQIDALFAGDTLGDILRDLRASSTDLATAALKGIGRGSPISVACAVAMCRRLRAVTDLRVALELEYRFTYRAMEAGDFLEGIRAAIIDKDRNPNWRHALDSVTDRDVAKMLAPLGDATLTFRED